MKVLKMPTKNGFVMSSTSAPEATGSGADGDGASLVDAGAGNTVGSTVADDAVVAVALALAAVIVAVALTITLLLLLLLWAANKNTFGRHLYTLKEASVSWLAGPCRARKKLSTICSK